MVDSEPWRSLDRALAGSLLPASWGTAPVTVLFSGGLDSGFLAWELRRRPATTLFSVGRPASPDLARGREAAALVGLPWSGGELSDAELDALDRELDGEDVRLEGPRRAIQLALLAAIVRAPGPRLLCGQGADELFLGYAHFRGLGEAEALARARADLAVAHDDWRRTAELGRRRGRELWAPFLTPALAEAVAGVPFRRHLPGEGPAKPVLRAWAQLRGLPAPIALAPKRAIQYGTRVDRWRRAAGSR